MTFYLGDNDVHLYTPAMRQFLLTQQHIPNLHLTLSQNDAVTIYEYQKYYQTLNPRVRPVFEKIWRRMDNRSGFYYSDPDLGINILAVLLHVLRVVRVRGSENEFIETMLEMDSHCPQGDSHRLLMLLFGLV